MSPFEVWWVEIAVFPPGERNLGLDRSKHQRLKTARVASALLGVMVALLGTWALVLHWVSSSSLLIDSGNPRPQKSEGPIRPSGCDANGWIDLQATCRDEMAQFYSDGGTSHVSNWLLRQLESPDETPMSDLNLGHVGTAWGTVQGVCSRTTNSQCAWALRGYLDFCPLDPDIVSATTSWNNWTLEDRDFGYPSDSSCSGLGVGVPCSGYIDLLFLRQCLGSAFPPLVTPSTLTLTDVATYDSPIESSEQQYSKHSKGQEAAQPRTVELIIDSGPCEIASATVINECGVACSTRACDHVQGVDPEFARPWEHHSDGAARSFPTNCKRLRNAPATVIEDSGCGCRCYANGTGCEAAIADALRVYAEAQRRKDPGCYYSELRPNSHGDQISNAGPGGSELLPASTLATMLYSARGIRWIPAF